MDFGGALVARSQAAEVVQVREAALDHPAVAAGARAVGCAATGDAVGDPPGRQDALVLVVVVATVGKDTVWPGAGAAELAGDRARGQLTQQRQKLGDVVAVDPRQPG